MVSVDDEGERDCPEVNQTEHREGKPNDPQPAAAHTLQSPDIVEGLPSRERAHGDRLVSDAVVSDRPSSHSVI